MSTQNIPSLDGSGYEAIPSSISQNIFSYLKMFSIQCRKNITVEDNNKRMNFPKFRPKIQSCPFCLKIATHGILEVLIPNPDLEFRNSNPKIFLGQFWPKIQSCPFCLKIGSNGILEVLIPNPGLELRNSDSKNLFGANLV